MTFGAFMMIIRSAYYPYLKTYFDMPAFRGQISTGTSTINQITGKMLNDIAIPVPDMEAVERFKTFVEQSDKSKFVVHRATKTLDISRIIIENKHLGGTYNSQGKYHSLWNEKTTVQLNWL